MQTKLQDKVFIVDEQMRHSVELNPAYNDIAKSFQVVLVNEIPRGLEVKQEGQPTPLGEKVGLYVQSPVYQNRYYPLFEWDNARYYEEIAACMQDLSHRMGISTFEYGFIETESSESESDSSANIGGGFQYKLVKGEAEFESKYKDAFGSNNSQKMSITSTIKGTRHNPNKLKAYIDKERINLDILPPSFRTLVKNYLDKPNVEITNYKYEIERIEEKNSYMEASKKFSANASVAGLFEAKFGIDIQDKSKKQYKKTCNIIFFLSNTK